MSVSLVAREGVAANMLFRWRRLMEDGALSAVSAEEAVAPISELRALQQWVREMERCLGRKTLECEILQEAVEYGKTKKFARELGIMPCTTPVRSPQSNGMAEAFVKNIKVDYASVHPCPDARTVLDSLSNWITDYNTQRPHTALKYKSPTQFRKDMIQAQLTP